MAHSKHPAATGADTAPGSDAHAHAETHAETHAEAHTDAPAAAGATAAAPEPHHTESQPKVAAVDWTRPETWPQPGAWLRAETWQVPAWSGAGLDAWQKPLQQMVDEGRKASQAWTQQLWSGPSAPWASMPRPQLPALEPVAALATLALDSLEAASRAMTETQQRAQAEAQANARRFAAESTRLMEAALEWPRELKAAGFDQAMEAARRGVERLRPDARG